MMARPSHRELLTSNIATSTRASLPGRQLKVKQSPCREKTYEIRITPDGVHPPFRYPAPSEVTHAPYDSPDHCDSGIAGKFADVAVQRGLGLLPQRRFGPARLNLDRIYTDGPAHRLA